MSAFKLRTIPVLAMLLLAGALTWTASRALWGPPGFVTWESLDLDARASIWLVERHIAPGERVEIYPAGTSAGSRIAFAIPDSPYARTHGVSAFEKLVAGYAIAEPEILRIAKIINAIEVSSWWIVPGTDADSVEQSYRWLQQYFEYQVPDECYGAFFDSVAAQLATADLGALPVRIAHLTESDQRCTGPVTGTVQKQRVQLIPAAEVLGQIAAGRDVVFVDVREAAEYREYHIPGAINLTLRNIDAAVVEELQRADLVIPYCIKDFRGYEAARKLADLGLAQVANMKPHGLAGWRSLKLPLVIAGAVSEDTARNALLSCARRGGICL